MMRGSVVAMGVLSTLLVSAAASPGEAQEPAAKARIGWLTIASHPMIEPFREGMRERGYVEGENLVIEYRYADGHADRLPQLAIDLARDRVDVVVASGSAAT